MLTAEVSGQLYVKRHHSVALMEQIGRTHRSVEFKHQNISAMLEELGMSWIQGYKPKRNYQDAIFGAIERYVLVHPEVLDLQPSPRLLAAAEERSEEHTSELQSLMRISYAVFCLKKKNTIRINIAIGDISKYDIRK